jgi:hypothetical protein
MIPCCLVKAIGFQMAATHEYGDIAAWPFIGENRRNSGKTLLQCHFDHYESHMKLQGIETEVLL